MVRLTAAGVFDINDGFLAAAGKVGFWAGLGVNKRPNGVFEGFVSARRVFIGVLLDGCGVFVRGFVLLKNSSRCLTRLGVGLVVVVGLFGRLVRFVSVLIGRRDF